MARMLKGVNQIRRTLMTKLLQSVLLACALVTLTNGVVAQKKDGPMQCRDSGTSDRLQTHCEIKEQTLPAGGAVTVDAKRNGGVRVGRQSIAM